MINTFKEIFKELDTCKALIAALLGWNIILTVFVVFLTCGEFKRIINDTNNDTQIVDIRDIQLEMLDISVEPIK